MAPGPDKKDDHEVSLTAEQAELMTPVKRKEIKTPDGAEEELYEREQKTLAFITEREDTLKERAGRLLRAVTPFMEGSAPTSKGAMVERIRTKGDQEAIDLAKKVSTFGKRAKEHLRFFSIRTADKLAKITARIRVAERTQNGIQRMQEHWNNEAERLSNLVDGLREAHGKNHPVMGLVPSWLTGATDLSEAARKGNTEMTQMLSEASQQVLQEEREEYRAYEEETKERFAPEQKAEEQLRGILADYAPEYLHELDEALDEASKGKPATMRFLLNTLIKGGPVQGSTLKELPPHLREPLMKALNASMDTLTSKEYARFRAFETASRLELAGLPPADLIMRLQELPIGTRLKATIKTVPGLTKNYVLLRKSGDNIVLKEAHPLSNKVVLLNTRTAALVVENKMRARTLEEQKQLLSSAGENEELTRKINARAGEIRKQRLAGKFDKLSNTDVDAMLVERGLTPGSKQASVFMALWDRVTAKRELTGKPFNANALDRTPKYESYPLSEEGVTISLAA